MNLIIRVLSVILFAVKDQVNGKSFEQLSPLHNISSGEHCTSSHKEKVCFNDVFIDSQYKLYATNNNLELSAKISGLMNIHQIEWTFRAWPSPTTLDEDDTSQIEEIIRNSKIESPSPHKPYVLSTIYSKVTHASGGIYTCSIIDKNNSNSAKRVLLSLYFYVDVIAPESQLKFSRCHPHHTSQCFEPFYHPEPIVSIDVSESQPYILHCAVRNYTGPVFWIYGSANEIEGYIIMGEESSHRYYSNLHDYMVQVLLPGIYTCLLTDNTSAIKPAVTFEIIHNSSSKRYEDVYDTVIRPYPTISTLLIDENRGDVNLQDVVPMSSMSEDELQFESSREAFTDQVQGLLSEEGTESGDYETTVKRQPDEKLFHSGTIQLAYSGSTCLVLATLTVASVIVLV